MARLSETERSKILMMKGNDDSERSFAQVVNIFNESLSKICEKLKSISDRNERYSLDVMLDVVENLKKPTQQLVFKNNMRLLIPDNDNLKLTGRTNIVLVRWYSISFIACGTRDVVNKWRIVGS